MMLQLDELLCDLENVFTWHRYILNRLGKDVHLFTVNAGSGVYVDVSVNEVIDVINVLNGFAPAQIAMTANSNIWQGDIDPQYKCVAEKFWDWWLPDEARGDAAQAFQRPCRLCRDGKGPEAHLCN